MSLRIGFYYHIPLRCDNSQYFLPGYLAVFLDALAREVNHLTLFLHEENQVADLYADTPLQEKNIDWINMGPKTAAWHRSIFSKKILTRHFSMFEKTDILIVRSPSPLAPYFQGIIPKEKIAYLVVGDYKEGVKFMKIRSLRDWLVKKYSLWNHRLFLKTLENAFVIVNSELLFNSLKNLTKNIHQVKTTTLSNTDFYERRDSFGQKMPAEINVLFTGRIVPEKGLEFVIEACKKLISKGMKIKFHVAGLTVKENYIDKLEKLCQYRHENFFVFHGYKKVGKDLNNIYRNSHIYILASTSDFEGFPRTIWEAMANSCPVIATTVGSIPNYLEHNKHALLIPPKNADAIAEAIYQITQEADLRMRLIYNGYALAKDNTLEIQTKKLVEILKNCIK